MKKLALLSCFITLLSMKCSKKEGPDCHKRWTFRNNSDYTILMAEYERFEFNGKCRVTIYKELKPHTEIEFKGFTECLEDMEERQGETLILSPELVGIWDVRYFECDSLDHYFKILKRYPNMQKVREENNYLVNYPE